MAKYGPIPLGKSTPVCEETGEVFQTSAPKFKLDDIPQEEVVEQVEGEEE